MPKDYKESRSRAYRSLVEIGRQTVAKELVAKVRYLEEKYPGLSDDEIAKSLLQDYRILPKQK